MQWSNKNTHLAALEPGDTAAKRALRRGRTAALLRGCGDGSSTPPGDGLAPTSSSAVALAVGEVVVLVVLVEVGEAVVAVRRRLRGRREGEVVRMRR